MVEGHSWGGASRKGSNHPTSAYVGGAPRYPEGSLSRTQVEIV